MSEQPGRYQRSPNALIGSMLVVLVAIVGFVVVRTLARGNQDVVQPTVDYAAAAKQARSEALVLAPAPDAMPKGWRATSVRYRGSPNPTWHVGIVTSKETYVAIEEANRTPSDLVAAYLDKGATRGGTVSIGGVEWRIWSAGTAYALTYRAGSDTVYVGGPAGRAATRRLVGLLDVSGTPGTPATS